MRNYVKFQYVIFNNKKLNKSFNQGIVNTLLYTIYNKSFCLKLNKRVTIVEVGILLLNIRTTKSQIVTDPLK